MNIYKKLKRISDRHQLSLFTGLIYEVFLRLYKFSIVKGIASKFYNERIQPLGWFFAVGSYNAGTTVIKNCIAAHPAITMPPVEADLLTNHLSDFEYGEWPRGLYANRFKIAQHRENDSLDYEGILSDWAPWLNKDKFFLEKSISNSVRIPLIRRSFPNSKFICVVRQPCGVISGIKKRSRPGDIAKRYLGNDSYPDNYLLRQYNYIYQTIISDSSSKDTIFCSYENFLADPESTINDIFAFLNLPKVPVIYRNSILTIGHTDVYIRPPKELVGLKSDVKSHLINTLEKLNFD